MISMGSENTGLGLTVRSLRETKGMVRQDRIHWGIGHTCVHVISGTNVL